MTTLISADPDAGGGKAAQLRRAAGLRAKHTPT